MYIAGICNWPYVQVRYDKQKKSWEDFRNVFQILYQAQCAQLRLDFRFVTYRLEKAQAHTVYFFHIRTTNLVLTAL
jgi:hypothetical protein